MTGKGLSSGMLCLCLKLSEYNVNIEHVERMEKQLLMHCLVTHGNVWRWLKRIKLVFCHPWFEAAVNSGAER